MRTATQTMKFTALYERLSRDDELIGESKADEVSKTYSMPKRFISLRSKEKTVTLTAEQKEQAKQRLPRTDK